MLWHDSLLTDTLHIANATHIGSVLVQQVGVLCSSRTSKVFHLTAEHLHTDVRTYVHSNNMYGGTYCNTQHATVSRHFCSTNIRTYIHTYLHIHVPVAGRKQGPTSPTR